MTDILTIYLKLFKKTKLSNNMPNFQNQILKYISQQITQHIEVLMYFRQYPVITMLLINKESTVA